MAGELEARVTELEIQLAFQKDLCQQLDEVVRDFGAQLDRLRGEIRDLRDEWGEKQPSSGPSSDLKDEFGEERKLLSDRLSSVLSDDQEKDEF